MCPLRRSIIPGATALLARNTDFKLVSNTVSQMLLRCLMGGSEVSDTGVVHQNLDRDRVFCLGVLHRRTKFALPCVTSTACGKHAGRVMARSSFVAPPGFAGISSTISVSLPFFPAAARLANPMPRLAPVTIATVPSQGFQLFISVNSSRRQFIVHSSSYHSRENIHSSRNWRQRIRLRKVDSPCTHAWLSL